MSEHMTAATRLAARQIMSIARLTKGSFPEADERITAMNHIITLAKDIHHWLKVQP